MKKNSNLAQGNDRQEVFASCFFIGLLGFFLTWQSDVDFSGIRGFLIGFLVPYILYILVSFLTRKEKKISDKTIQVSTDEITIKETNKGEKVEINISIPKSLLTLKNNA